MYKKNEGLTDNDILQNQFTTFLSTALCNHRKTYLRGIYRCRWRECVTDEIRSVCIYDFNTDLLRIMNAAFAFLSHLENSAVFG